jgi:hypothetical protein
MIYCLTCGIPLAGGDTGNDGIVVFIHAMAGHELDVLELP